MMYRLLLVLVATALLSFALSWCVRRIAQRFMVVDLPMGGRKIHRRAIPLWGGIGIGISIISMMAVFVFVGVVEARAAFFPSWIAFAVAILMLLAVGALDDVRPVSPILRLCIYLGAAVVIVLSGARVLTLTNWLGGEPWSLAWRTVSEPWSIWSLRLVWPADLVTILWFVMVTLSVKIMDSLDGLITGQTVIGAILMALLALTPALYQPDVAFLCVIVAASFLGFLYWNAHPAKQFLGEAGSVIAGCSLAFLAVLSGAKFAIALMAVGIPLADAARVLIGRFRCGRSLLQGDDTHLPFLLLKAGYSQRQIVFGIWGISALFGILALYASSLEKVALTSVLVLGTMTMPIILTSRRRVC